MLKVVILVVVFVGACSGSKPNAPIIPKLPDPINIDDFVLDVHRLYMTQLSSGIFSLCKGTITGLSRLEDVIIAPGLGRPKFRVNITLPVAEITGRYTSDIKLPGLGNISLTGRGSLSGILENLHVSVAVLLVLPGPTNPSVSIRNLTIDMEFDKVAVNIENFALNGAIIDWDEFNRNIKENFDSVWGGIQGSLSDLIVNTVNTVIKDCTILDLIEIIGGGPTKCLKLPTPLQFGIRNDIEIPCQGPVDTSTTEKNPPTSSLINPVFQCPEATGNFADPADCSRFFVCQQNIIAGHLTCPNGFLFNPNIGNCDYPWKVNCDA